MQIPLTLPEQTTPLPTRRDIQALSPVSPVPGVESQAETLDPRLALQWTQPVLADQSADLARSVLERASMPMPAQAPATGTPTTSPAVAWSSLAQALGPLLQRIQNADPSVGVRWPTSDTSLPGTDAQASNGLTLHQAMQSLRSQLAQSDVFAAQHLVEQWFKAPDQASSSAHATAQEPATHDVLSRWMSALSPDHSTAQDITRMLLNGKMHWQGELLPGVAVTLEREDAWREDPQQPGHAQKGAALRAHIDLPRSGRMTVNAYQWGTHIEVRVALPALDDSPLISAWPQLQEQLAQLKVSELQLTREKST
jgi:hypothetical protein